MPKRLKLNQRISSDDGYIMCRVYDKEVSDFNTYTPNTNCKNAIKWCRKTAQGSWAVSTSIVTQDNELFKFRQYCYFGFKDLQDLLMFQLSANNVSLYTMWNTSVRFTITEQEPSETNLLSIPLIDNNIYD